jgi:DNA-binding MarR family transcriptional regulator
VPSRSRSPVAPSTETIRLLEQELTLLARHQLSSAQHTPELSLDRSGFQLLSRIELGPLTLKQLAEAFRLDISTVNRQIAALRTKGLVERVPDPDGGIARLLRPTRLGLTMLRKDRAVRHEQVGRVLEAWDPADVVRLHELLALFNTSIEELEGEAWPRP